MKHALYRRSGDCQPLATVLDRMLNQWFVHTRHIQAPNYRQLTEFATGYDLFNPDVLQRVVCRLTGKRSNLVYLVNGILRVFQLTPDTVDY